VIDKYAEHGTSVALSGKPDSFFSRKEIDGEVNSTEGG
jgi:hypothetical protein